MRAEDLMRYKGFYDRVYKKVMDYIEKIQDIGLTELEQDVREIIQKVCSDYGAECNIKRYWRADPVQFDKSIISALEKVAKARAV